MIFYFKLKYNLFSGYLKCLKFVIGPYNEYILVKCSANINIFNVRNIMYTFLFKIENLFYLKLSFKLNFQMRCITGKTST